MNDIIRKYIGCEYKHNGREDTLDCLGLVVSFLRENGIKIPDNDGREIKKEWYKKEPQRLVRGFAQYGNVISFDKLKPLDVVIFALDKETPAHAGVMVDNMKFLHVIEGSTARLSRIEHWKKYFYTAFHIERR